MNILSTPNRFALILLFTLSTTSITSTLSTESTAADPPTTRFQLALPGYDFQFPRDHASHPDFRTEWWYFTGNVQSTNGDPFGYELTLFRHRVDDTLETFEHNPSRWAEGNFYFAHFAVTDAARKAFFYDRRHARPASGLAGASATECNAFIHDWSIQLKEGAFHLKARSRDHAIELQCVPEKPHVIQGVDGVSQKSDGHGQASHYISFTRLKTSGKLVSGGRELTVTGSSWMDHEFGSNQLGEDQIGWDWFCIQLDNNTEVMLYNMRRKDGAPDPHSSGTWIAPDGIAEHLTNTQWSFTPTSTWKSPHTDAIYPMGWTIEVPGRGLSLELKPLLEDQELADAGYWEGAVLVEGTLAGKAIKGQGYVELVGYAGSIVGL